MNMQIGVSCTVRQSLWLQGDTWEWKKIPEFIYLAGFLNTIPAAESLPGPTPIYSRIFWRLWRPQKYLPFTSGPERAESECLPCRVLVWPCCSCSRILTTVRLKTRRGLGPPIGLSFAKMVASVYTSGVYCKLGLGYHLLRIFLWNKRTYFPSYNAKHFIFIMFNYGCV